MMNLKGVVRNFRTTDIQYVQNLHILKNQTTLKKSVKSLIFAYRIIIKIRQ